MAKSKIFYVEDDATLAFLTIDYLEQFYDITHFSDGAEAVKNFHKGNYDLCILDVMLPKKDGFEIAQEIRNSNTEIPILFLSAKSLKEDRIKGLKLGADDFLVKPFSLEELSLKIEVFLKRSSKAPIIAQKSYEIGSFQFFPNDYCLTRDTEKINLTERESALLKLFLDNKNEILKREKILTALWGDDDYFMGRSLDVFISRLRKIFKEENSVKIENIPRIGFKLVME
ncbi:response regulator transcription factor [Flavobacterium microcysteis]|uniref:Response regulator transcription factor n=1 Tax=Flavobacterium microcysteis TaxID=2596891 RepID=A0A501QGX4_9FLAO|nr:response regulator transcription factor [Flavobacterium microcysteis]TPD72030.1 response regulator transcription factor [Flavobacterium microcysteis]